MRLDLVVRRADLEMRLHLVVRRADLEMRLDLVVRRADLEMRLHLVVRRADLEMRLDLVVRRADLEMRLHLVVRRADLEMRLDLVVRRADLEVRLDLVVRRADLEVRLYLVVRRADLEMRLHLVVRRTDLEVRLDLVVRRTDLEVRLHLVVRRADLEVRLHLVVRRADLQVRVPLGVERRRLVRRDVVAILVIGGVEIARDADQVGIEQRDRALVDFARRRQAVVVLELRQGIAGARSEDAVDRAGIIAQQRQGRLDRERVDRPGPVIEPLDGDAVRHDVGRIARRNVDAQREGRRLADPERESGVEALDAGAEIEAGPVAANDAEQRRLVRLHEVPEVDGPREDIRAAIGERDGEVALRAAEALERTGLVDVQIVALRLRDTHRRRSTSTASTAATDDFNVADLRCVVFQRLDADRCARRRHVGVEVDEVGGERAVGRIRFAARRVGTGRAGGQNLGRLRDARALETVHLVRVRQLARRRVDAGAGGRTEKVPAHPHRFVRTVRIDRAGAVVAIAEVDAAGGVRPQPGRTDAAPVVEADVVAALRRPRPVLDMDVTQHACRVRLGEGLRLVQAEVAHAAALGDEHLALRRNREVGHDARPLGRGAEIRQDEFAADVRGIESAILVEADGPDGVLRVVARCRPVGRAERVAAGDGVVEAGLARRRIGMDREAPDPAAEIGDVPAGRRQREIGRSARAVGAVEQRGRAVGIEGDRSQRLVGAAGHVEEGGAPLRSVVEAIDMRAVQRHAMDHAALQIGDEELAEGAVEGDVAERRAAVLAAVEIDDREDLGRVAIVGAEHVDRARAALAELARQPVAAVLEPVEAEGGCRGQVDRRFRAIRDGDAEHLADLGRRHFQVLRFVRPVAAVGGEAWIADVDGACDHAVLVDERQARSVAERDLGRSGEPGREGLAGGGRLLGEGRRHERRGCKEKRGYQRGSSAASLRRDGRVDGSHAWFLLWAPHRGRHLWMGVTVVTRRPVAP